MLIEISGGHFRGNFKSFFSCVTYWAECGRVSAVAHHQASSDVQPACQHQLHVLAARHPHAATASSSPPDYTHTHTHHKTLTIYKCWLVPRSTLKNYAPKLCNVARGPKAWGQHCTTEGHNFSVLIEANSQYLFCYMTENMKELSHSALPAYSNW